MTAPQPLLCACCGYLANSTVHCLNCGQDVSDGHHHSIPLTDYFDPHAHQRERRLELVPSGGVDHTSTLIATRLRGNGARMRVVKIGVSVAIAAFIVMAVALAMRTTVTTPRKTVEKYFNAIADGDAVTALALIRSDAVTDRPLLTDQALSVQDNLPQDIRVGEARAAENPDMSLVPVTYRARDRDVKQTIIVSRESDSSFRIRNPFVPLTVTDPGRRNLSVNGVPVEGGSQLVAFPGAFSIRAEGNVLFDPAEAQGVPESTGYTTPVFVQIETPTLASTAEETIRSKVAERLSICSESTDLNPVNCPFGLDSFLPSEVSVRWTITSNGTIALGPINNGEVQFTTNGATPGVVHYEVEYSDGLGNPVQDVGETAFTIRGSARAASDGISVSLD